MQNHVKFLCVEDDKEWNRGLCAAIGDFFRDVCKMPPKYVEGISAYDGDQGYQQVDALRWDIVTVDMNLSPPKTGPKISGLDVIGKIAAGNRAFFVIIITGAAHDPHLQPNYGRDVANRIRVGALNEAIRQLPAHRVRIINKPKGTVAHALAELRRHLHDVLHQYVMVSMDRNVFRRVPGSTEFWEVCHNGGRRVDLPHAEGFEMIRSALSQPHREQKVVRLIKALAQSSGKLAPVSVAKEKKATSPVGAQSREEGNPDFDRVGGRIVPQLPSDFKEESLSLDDLIKALIHGLKQEADLEATIREVIGVCGRATVVAMQRRIAFFIDTPRAAVNEFADRDVVEKLKRIHAAVETLLVENIAEPEKPIRVSSGSDTKELVLARKQWERFLSYIRRHPFLKDFSEHIKASMDRGQAARGRISYKPPGDVDSSPFWRTD